MYYVNESELYLCILLWHQMYQCFMLLYLVLTVSIQCIKLMRVDCICVVNLCILLMQFEYLSILLRHQMYQCLMLSSVDYLFCM